MATPAQARAGASGPLARRLATAAFVAAAGLALSACAVRQVSSDGSLLGLITPYRIEIVQGNVVTREQVALVRPGMRREQVRDVLGSPMLTDPFHAERWDYIFTLRRQGADPQTRAVVAHFRGDVLERLEVPEALPSENEFVAAMDPVKRRLPTRPLELTEEQRKALPVPARPATPPPAGPGGGPLRPYPPLEPT